MEGLGHEVRSGRMTTVIDPTVLARAVTQLEPLPATVTRLASMVASDDWSIDEVEQTIALDPALTGRLLQFANSAASASLVPIATVRAAVVRVGIGSVLSFATASSVVRHFQRAVPEYGLSEGELWRHGVASALGAELTNSVTDIHVPPEVFTAALLHDVGKLVLARFLKPEPLRRLAEAREAGGLTSMRAESEILGVHHGELGGLIGQRWKLPERLVRGIAFHHTPDEGQDLICDVVHVANIAAKTIGYGPVASDRDLALNPGSVERLRLTADAFAILCHKLKDRVQQVISRYT